MYKTAGILCAVLMLNQQKRAQAASFSTAMPGTAQRLHDDLKFQKDQEAAARTAAAKAEDDRLMASQPISSNIRDRLKALNSDIKPTAKPAPMPTPTKSSPPVEPPVLAARP